MFCEPAQFGSWSRARDAEALLGRGLMSATGQSATSMRRSARSALCSVANLYSGITEHPASFHQVQSNDLSLWRMRVWYRATSLRGEVVALKLSFALQQSLERKIASIVAAIEEGKYSRALGDRLADLERQRDLISTRKVENPQGTIRLHPRLADVYAEKVQQLEEALNEPSIREEAAEVLPITRRSSGTASSTTRARGSKPSSMATWSKFWDFATRTRKKTP